MYSMRKQRKIDVPILEVSEKLAKAMNSDAKTPD